MIRQVYEENDKWVALMFSFHFTDGARSTFVTTSPFRSLSLGFWGSGLLEVEAPVVRRLHKA